jgi:nucleoid DNA-binding protein
MARNKKEIIYFLANKHNLPLKTVEEIVDVQFKFVNKIMKQGEFNTIRLPYFGKFTVNKNRIKYINKLKDGVTRRSNNDK